MSAASPADIDRLWALRVGDRVDYLVTDVDAKDDRRVEGKVLQLGPVERIGASHRRIARIEGQVESIWVYASPELRVL
ncbi:MAG TPA: hypothetical protein VGI39_01480 [Polyangiaceae bacterium]|jgi:hypothetical protein